ncbi:MoaD/ThiS family protein [Solidesulfovibrio sp.]
MSDTVTIRALATLAPYAPPGGVASIGPGETVGELADRLGLGADDIGVILVNGNPATLEAPLTPGDAVSFVPPITGG